MENITVILVCPQMGENIGAMARAMKNFGITHLRIVNPRDGWPNQRANELAVSAKDILDNAEIFDNFESAIADINIIYATSARSRNINKENLTPEMMSKEIVSFTKDKKIAILFGRENNGLNNEEISFADKLVSIPVNKDLWSLNLAQAGVVIFYELFKNLYYSPPVAKEQDLASGEEISGLFTHLENELDRRSFFKVAEKREGMILNIRSMFKRIKDFSVQDVRTFRGIIRSLSENNHIKRN